MSETFGFLHPVMILYYYNLDMSVIGRIFYA